MTKITWRGKTRDGDLKYRFQPSCETGIEVSVPGFMASTFLGNGIRINTNASPLDTSAISALP
jgi:hypothetical protein